MISVEDLKRVKSVYVHGKCPDGLGSAIVLMDAFQMLGMRPSLEFLVHNTDEVKWAGRTPRFKDCPDCIAEPIPMIPDEGDFGSPCPSCGGSRIVNDPEALSLFCDIVPYEGNVEEMAGNTIVLDHHAGVRHIVEAFGERGVFADAETEPGVSGTSLAYREVWMSVLDHVLASKFKGDKDRPINPVRDSEMATLFEKRALVAEFALLSGLRDCRVLDHPRFQDAQHLAKFLMSKPLRFFINSDEPNRDHVPFLNKDEMKEGEILFNAHDSSVSSALSMSVQMTAEALGEKLDMLVFQDNAVGFRLTSDLSERAVEAGTSATVVAGFFYTPPGPGGDPVLTYSLRGLKGFDVSAFARANGGNGHVNMAGFAVDPLAACPYGGPYGYIKYRLECFLRNGR
jgi:hypothetical protein